MQYPCTIINLYIAIASQPGHKTVSVRLLGDILQHWYALTCIGGEEGGLHWEAEEKEEEEKRGRLGLYVFHAGPPHM